MVLEAKQRVRVGGPHFEDFEVGQEFSAPALTITSGHAAIHQALVGDRLRLPLDSELSAAVTGRPEALAHPNLVCDVAIGQSTDPTQLVRGNLFYRGLVLHRPVFIGETLRTTTEVVGLKQNRPRDDGSATGLVVLRMRTENQRGEAVLDFWRCPMIPLRDSSAQTGHASELDEAPQELNMEDVRAAASSDWDYAAFRHQAPGEHFDDIVPGTVYEVEGRDTVTSAPELARLTLNVARTHLDAGAGARGRRLVYGGYTISMAAAAASRALPNLLTILAWRGCDHTGPVFEDDVLATELTVVGAEPLDEVGAGLLDLRAVVHAEREGADEPQPVLDWSFIGMMAR